MFSFFGKKCLLKRAAFAGLVLIVAALLCAGCKLDDEETENTGFIPVGEWSDGFGTGYNITGISLDYYSPDFGPGYPAQNLTGSIEKAVDFSGDTGVLIIKITHVENMDHTDGKFTCVYYKEYTNSHVYLANPAGPSYEIVETDSVSQALSLFTSGNMDTHVTFWGSGYTK